MSSESRRLGGIRGQNIKNVRRSEDFEWITVDGMPLKRRRPRRKPTKPVSVIVTPWDREPDR